MSDFIKLEEINLKTSSECDEKWIQKTIADHPEILGLGNLALKDKERIQPNGGRLDLLLNDEDDETRYEVEIQLGKTDESHIIRTIEYWDVEKNRYPNKNHVAVIVAEDITHRFLNVIHLFNKSIPLIALKMTAYKMEKGIALTFTKVLDLALVEDDDSSVVYETTDRNYWETKSTKEMLKNVDTISAYVQSVVPETQLNYNKHYIGLSRNGISNNFVRFEPRKQHVLFFAKIPRSDEFDEKMQDIDFNWSYGEYRLNLNAKTIGDKKDLIVQLITAAAKEKGVIS